MEPVVILFTKSGEVRRVVRGTAEDYAEKKGYSILWGRDQYGGAFRPAGEKGWHNDISFICSHIED